MARGPIKIEIASETGAYEKGIKSGVIEPTKDADKALTDLGKNKGPDRLEKELQQAEKATENLGDEVKRTASAIEKDFRQSYKRIGSGAKEGMDQASETTEEFKSEALQNFSEVTSSFTGDMQSAVDLVQGTLGGLASGIGGPLGLVLGVAGAAVGALVQGLVDGEQRAEELRQKARDLATEAVGAGDSFDGYITGAEKVADRIRELEELKSTDKRWFWEDDPTQLQEWEKALRKIGRSSGEISTVLGSSTDTLKDYTAGVKEARQAELERGLELAKSGKITQQQADAMRDQRGAYDDLIKYLEQEITLRNEGTASSERQRDAGIDAAIKSAEAEQARAEAMTAVQDSVTSAYDSMRDAATSYATGEDGALDINRWLTYVQEHQAAVAQYQANIEGIRLSPEQWANLLEMPEGQRMQWVAQFAALPDDARAPFAAALNDVGSSGGSEAAVAFDDSFKPDAKVDVDVTVDTAKPTADLDAVAKTRTAKIDTKTEGVDRARTTLDDLAKTRTATIRVDADTSRADAAIDNWIDRNDGRTINLRARVHVDGGQDFL